MQLKDCRISLLSAFLLTFILNSNCYTKNLDLNQYGKNNLEQYLPKQWKIKTFQLFNGNYFKKDKEKINKLRFKAEVVSLEDSYVVEEKINDVSFLTLLTPKGCKRTIYGIINFIKSNQSWETNLIFDNEITLQLGETLSSFSGKVIIHGSEEEREYKQKQVNLQRKLIVENARKIITQDIPSYLELTNFYLIGNTAYYINDYDEKEIFEQRFVATVKVDISTFQSINEIDDFTILIPSTKKDDKIYIYGKIQTSMDEYEQYIELIYDNNINKNIGLPSKNYTGKVSIYNSKEAESILQKRHKDKIDNIKNQKKLEEKKYKVKSSRIDFNAKLDEKIQAQLIKKLKSEAAKEREKTNLEIQEILLFKNKLDEHDPKKWRHTIEEMLDSDDSVKQNMAIASILNRSKNIYGAIATTKRPAITRKAIKLHITHLDLTTYQFSGDVVLFRIVSNDKISKFFGTFKGSLQGSVLYIDGTFTSNNGREKWSKDLISFSFYVELNDKGTMTGAWGMDHYSRNSLNMVTVNLLEMENFHLLRDFKQYIE
ncbi:hypothetical protein [Desulfogranum marinum]|uniref:hypothetical protein n=1 Tax=Desulfogranum marinum TaxID=453220 RepID=UPI0019641637|nr:hypothetical protein [Desulfogranum marinum]MBM9514877.1 hypothetical protein [Desulfogranum marinum]